MFRDDIDLHNANLDHWIPHVSQMNEACERTAHVERKAATVLVAALGGVKEFKNGERMAGKAFLRASLQSEPQRNRIRLQEN